METEFTPLLSLAGGALIGVSAVLLMALNGRIAGMTGIFSGLLPPMRSDWPWRAAFVFGAVVGPALFVALGGAMEVQVPVSMISLLVGGFLVGIGVTFGSGCPSGHGICGIARLSRRSIVATLTFMVSTFATVFLLRHVLGG